MTDLVQHSSTESRLLQAFRWAWIGFAIFTAWVIARGTLDRLGELSLVADNAYQTVGQLTPADAAELGYLGLVPQDFAVYFTLAETGTAIVFVAMAWLWCLLCHISSAVS
jgi:hypothetical protein